MLAKNPVRKDFSVKLEPSGNSLNWVIVHIPFDSPRLWGKRGTLRVKGNINGFEFRTSLFPDGQGGHIMVINKEMQKGGRVGPGMSAKFRMEPDLDEKAAPGSVELEKALAQSKPLKKFFQTLSPSTRRDIARHVADARQAATRVRRAEQMAERLMETMDAEEELPPLIKKAFWATPGAMAAWERLPPSHRRAHLMSIFYYRDLDSRLRRIEKTVEETLRYCESNDRTDRKREKQNVR